MAEKETRKKLMTDENVTAANEVWKRELETLSSFADRVKKMCGNRTPTDEIARAVRDMREQLGRVDEAEHQWNEAVKAVR